jgi:aspartate kinase
MKIVMKFGGSSVADLERIRRCARIVLERSAKDRVAVVVSALDGMTEELLELADEAGAARLPGMEARLREIRRRHGEIARGLGEPELLEPMLDRLGHLALGISAVGECTPRSRDAVVSFGERLSAVLLRKALEAGGARARSWTGQEAGLVTDERWGEAEPFMDLSLPRIAAALEGPLQAGEVPVVTGFIAATKQGVTTTIGRGGSDYTATIVGAALQADEVWLWSDVEGLMSADPRIVPAARRLDRISFPEAIEMGLFGAKSMHPRALEPAAERRLPVRMKNTFNPSGEGTLITDEGPASGDTVRSVLLVKDAGLITVTGAAMMGRPGTAGHIFRALGEQGINIRMIVQSVSEAGISFALSGAQLAKARAALEASVLKEHEARRLQVEEKVGIVAVVGANMKGVPGVAARVFSAVARRAVNVIAIAQGSSEISISLVVKGETGVEAVRALHDEFLGAKP